MSPKPASTIVPDEDKTREQLLSELQELKARMAILREAEVKSRSTAEALRESEKRLRLAQQVARTGTFEWDIQTGVNKWTPELEAMYGLPTGGFPGTYEAWRQLVYPEDRPEAVRRVREAMDKGGFEGEWRVIWPDDTIHWLYGRAFVFKDESGKPLKVIGINIDITERKRMEEELRRSRDELEVKVRERTRELRDSDARLARAQYIAHLGSWDWDFKTGKIEWSDECYRVLGHQPGEVKPITYDFFISHVHPDDVERMNSSVHESILTRKPFSIDFRSIRPDGSIVYAHNDWELLYDMEGSPIRMFGIVQDITELRRAEEALQESEERFRATFEQAAVGIAHVALDGRLIRFNQKLCDITGYTREELSELTFQDITYPEDLESGLRNMERLLAGEVQTYSMEKRYVKKDGSIVWVNLTVSLLYKNGKPEHFISVIEDITERKQAEANTRAAKDRLAVELDVMSRLHKISTRFVQQGTLNGLLNEILNAAMAITGADMGTIQLIEGSGVLKIVVQRGFGQSYIDFFNTVREDSGASCGMALRLRERVIMEDVARSPVFVGTPALVIQLAAGVRAVQSTPIFSRSGELLGVLSTHYKTPRKHDDRDLKLIDLLARQTADVIERARAEEALRESEEKFRSLVENINYMVWEMDENYTYTYASPKTIDVLGYAPDEVVGKKPFDFMPRKDSEYLLEVLNSISAEPRPFKFITFMAIKKDGTPIVIETNGTPKYDANGKLIGFRGINRDVTELKRAEEEISRLASIVTSSDDAIIGKTLDGTITSWNKGAEMLYGYSEAEAVGKPIGIIMPHDRLQELEEMLVKIRRGEHVEHYETVRVTKDGRRIDVSIAISPIVDAARNVIGASTITRDITRRKRAEEALRESEASLARSQAIAHLGSLELDVRTNVVRCSDELYRAFNLGPDVTMDAYIGKLHPEDRPRVVESINAAIYGGKPYNFDCRIVPRPDEVRYVHAEGEVARDKNGLPVKFFGIVQDVTELKKAQDLINEERQRLFSLLDGLPAFVYLLARDYSIRFANQSFRKTFGEPQNRPCYEAILCRSKPCPGCQTFKVFDTLKPEQWELTTATGYTYEIYDYPFRDIDGTSLVLSMGIDITERKQMEEALNETKAQAELYLDLMSHDINNLNMVVQGYLELIGGMVEDEKLKDLVSKPLDAVNDSTHLIENVRKLQKVQTGKLKAEAVDLNRILSELQAQYSKAPGKDVTIYYTHGPGCVVMADGLIKDVFSNLVWNAIKHSYRESVRVDLELKRQWEDGKEYCKVVVEDDGPGIPDAQKDKIFARFQQGNTKASGKGLGLYLVKTLVEGYHGRVWVEDRVHGDHTKGARFVVMLPVVEK